MSHAYSSGFFDYVGVGSRRSASVIIPYVKAMLGPQSVIDVGCGRGVWLDRWCHEGVRDIAGIDGSYVDASTLAIPEGAFVRHDLSQPVDLGRRFDLAQCLEVAEHIPERSSDVLIDSLARHADLVLFSAATPGQGGEHHVNEQPLDYWRAKFSIRGYAAYDPIRPLIGARNEVAPWYRFNTLVYANKRGEARLNSVVRLMRLSDRAPVPDLRPWPWRARCAVLRALPAGAIDVLASVKHFAATTFSAKQPG